MNRRSVSLTAAGLFSAWTATSAIAQTEAKSEAERLAYGKHLAQECTTCHRLDGSGNNIPSIIGLRNDYFVSTMTFYKTGARDNAVMNSVAQMLNDEQLEALATYFAQVKPPAKTTPASSRKK